MAHGEFNRQVLKLAIVLYASKIENVAYYVGSTIEQKQETSVSKK